MDAGHRLADGKQPVDGGFAVGVDSDATHPVVGGGCDLDRFLGHIDAELLEPLVHPRQSLLNEVGLAVGDIEIDTTVLGAAALGDLLGDRAGDDIAGV